MPNPSNPVYLQQVSNALNMLNSNLGIKARQKNDFVITPRLDYQASSRDSLFASFNVNWFDSPGGVITVSPVAVYGAQTLADANVHDFQATVGWTHTFSSTLLNEFHFGASDDNQISTPTASAANLPTILLESPTFFTLGNAPFSVGRVFERQWSVGDRIDWVVGKHTLQFGFDMTYAYDADSNDGGADPNADVEFGSPLGSYVFTSLEGFALGEYNTFTQASGNPRFAFSVPYYGFYVQDSYRVLPQLTLQMGLREDFQVYPQPAENPAFPLTGQYPNQFLRLGPRFGFAWQPMSKTVVRGGFGQFYTNMNGLNYRNAVISNGLPSQQSSLSASYNPALAPNQQTPSVMGGNVFGPTFPGIVPGNSPLFQASPDISLVSPQFKAPYVLQGSLQIEREISRNTTVSIGTMWNHGVHLLNGSANDLNLQPLQGTTTYIVCPPGTTTAPCNGQTIVLPNMDSGLLTEGRINPNLGQINELISTGQNYYNSMYVQLQHRMSDGPFRAVFLYAGQKHHAQRDGLQQSVRLQQHPCSVAAGPTQQHQLCGGVPAEAGKMDQFGRRARDPLELAGEQCHGFLFRPPLCGVVEPRVHEFDHILQQLRRRERKPERHRLQRRHREHRGRNQWRRPDAGDRPKFLLWPMAGEN